MGNQSGSGKGSNGFQLTGGGAGQPFNFGPSPFDVSAIDAAVGDNTAAVTNRYKQLGLGGSTMEQQDLAGQKAIGDAAIGQEQTQTVSDPAINTALQPSINQLIGVGSTQSANQGLTSALSSLANQAAGSNAFSSGASSITDSTLSDAATGAAISGG